MGFEAMSCHTKPLCICNQSLVYRYIYTNRKVKYENLRSPQYVARLQDLEINAYFRLFKEAWSNFLPKLIE